MGNHVLKSEIQRFLLLAVPHRFQRHDLRRSSVGGTRSSISPFQNLFISSSKQLSTHHLSTNQSLHPSPGKCERNYKRSDVDKSVKYCLIFWSDCGDLMHHCTEFATGCSASSVHPHLSPAPLCRSSLLSAT